MRGFTAVLAAWLVVPLSTLSAQEPLPIEPGQRVRVTAPQCLLEKQAGTVQAFRRDTLFMDAINCPLASVTALEVSRGLHRRTGRGALIGAATGVALLLTLDILLEEACHREAQGAFYVEPDATSAASIVRLAATGALLGAGIGALIRTDRWEEVPLDRLRVSLAPQRDGRFALGFRIAF